MFMRTRYTVAVNGILPQRTAAENQLQENPPDRVEQDEEALLPRPASEAETGHEKADMSLHVLLPPQEGHSIFFPLSPDKTSCSKTFPHSLHLYS